MIRLRKSTCLMRTASCRRSVQKRCAKRIRKKLRSWPRRAEVTREEMRMAGADRTEEKTEALPPETVTVAISSGGLIDRAGLMELRKRRRVATSAVVRRGREEKRKRVMLLASREAPLVARRLILMKRRMRRVDRPGSIVAVHLGLIKAAQTTLVEVVGAGLMLRGSDITTFP